MLGFGMARDGSRDGSGSPGWLGMARDGSGWVAAPLASEVAIVCSQLCELVCLL